MTSQKMMLLPALLLVSAIIMDPIWLTGTNTSRETAEKPVNDTATIGTHNDLEAMRSRPLFSPTRAAWTAPEEEVVRQVEQDALAGLVLSGVLALPGKPASVWLNGGPLTQPTRLNAGDSVADWIIEDISADQVVLVRGEEKRVLELNK